TLEPCAMCAAAISLAHVRRIYFGAYDPKGGAVEHGPRWFQQPTCLHQPEIYGGIEESHAGDLLRRFFQDRRYSPLNQVRRSSRTDMSAKPTVPQATPAAPVTY